MCVIEKEPVNDWLITKVHILDLIESLTNFDKDGIIVREFVFELKDKLGVKNEGVPLTFTENL